MGKNRNYCRDCVCCKQIMKHPQNWTPEFRGSVKEQVAFGCILGCDAGIDNIIILDTNDGECEMFEHRKGGSFFALLTA